MNVGTSRTRHIRETLGVAFRRRTFFDGAPEDLPFTEPIGTRGWLVTFASHFRGASAHERELQQDIEILTRLDLGSCRYGATDAPVLPFLCELRAGRTPLTGVDVIAGLNARNFRSEHIPTLRSTRIAYPGYHPHTENDEIHNDFAKQRIFEKESATESDGAHGTLKRYLEGGQLWYVLLHPTRHEGICDFVFLFAVGHSPHGGRLVGVVTHQVCHNLCD